MAARCPSLLLMERYRPLFGRHLPLGTVFLDVGITLAEHLYIPPERERANLPPSEVLVGPTP